MKLIINGKTNGRLDEGEEVGDLGEDFFKE